MENLNKETFELNDSLNFQTTEFSVTNIRARRNLGTCGDFKKKK